MTFQPGDVVALKSGGQFLTVSGVSDENVECIWIGEEGELFRETLPLAVLKAVDLDEDPDGDDESEDAGGDEDDAEPDQEVRKIA